MIGAHTDSPCLKLRPVSKSTKSGFLMVNVETYGGGLWYTWFDRDLGLAGRVLVRSKAPGGAEGSENSGMQHRLVKLDRPILRIPMLAIHLQRDIHTAGFKPNLQTNFAPILATAAKTQLGLDKTAAPTSSESQTPASGQGINVASAIKESGKHHQVLLDMVAKELDVSAADIVDFELHL
jgi:aspartyl aminopeptidase